MVNKFSFPIFFFLVIKLTFLNIISVPGHSGRKTISVASSRAPTIQPRMNRSSLMRQSENTTLAPTSNFAPRTSSSASRSRASSSLSTNTPIPITIPKVVKPPTILPRMNRTEQLRTAKKEEEEKMVKKLASMKVRKPGEMRMETKSKPAPFGENVAQN